MKKKLSTRKVSASYICEDILGGNYNPSENTCQLLEQPEMLDRSVSDDPKYALYYILQIFIGTSFTFFGTFFGVTIVPPWWYLNLIFLIIASAFFLYADWYRENDAVESLKRFVILIPIYIIASILIATAVEFGTILNGKYWNLMLYLTSDPIIATIQAIFLASLLNVFLLPKGEVISVLESV